MYQALERYQLPKCETGNTEAAVWKQRLGDPRPISFPLSSSERSTASLQGGGVCPQTQGHSPWWISSALFTAEVHYSLKECVHSLLLRPRQQRLQEVRVYYYGSQYEGSVHQDRWWEGRETAAHIAYEVRKQKGVNAGAQTP